MSNQRTEIFDLFEFSVSAEVLRKCSNDIKATYGILSLNYSELVAMQKMLRLGPRKKTGDDVLDQCSLSQRFFILRLMSSKILEVYKSITGCGKYNKTSDEELLVFRRTITKPSFESVERMNGYTFAKAIRDKVGFHYDLKNFSSAAGLNGADQEHEFLCSIGSHSQFFPYGEILVSSMLGNNEGSSCIDTARNKIRALTDFITKAMEELMNVFRSFLEQFIFPECKQKSVQLEVPESLIGIPEGSPFPLFISQKGKRYDYPQ